MSDQVAREPGDPARRSVLSWVRLKAPQWTTAVTPSRDSLNQEDVLPALPHTVGLARSARQEIATIRTLDLMQAMVAAYALMAHADGEAAAAERRRMLTILRENRALSIFSREELVREMAEHEANYRYDPEVAQEIAQEKLALVSGQPRAILQILEACRSLIAADGITHPAEYRALATIKALLGAAEVDMSSPAARLEAGWR